MEIPIYIDGAATGTLTIRQQDAATVLDARLADPGRVVRLTVYGAGTFYLGVPVPEGDGLRLTRRITPRDMRRFPRDPVYAAETRREPESPQPPEGPPSKRVLWLGGRPYYF